MKITIEAEPKEMADLVSQLQNRQGKTKFIPSHGDSRLCSNPMYSTQKCSD